MHDEERHVLKANEAFYAALINNDYQTMESLWAHASEVAVIHPGWPPLHGREAVMDSWRRILAGPAAGTMYCSNVKSYIMDQVAFVICSECFHEGELVATNIFIREAGAWKIVHHQGGPLQAIDEDGPPESIH